MAGTTVEITTPDGVADAYLTRPDDRPRPGVLFVMDVFGLRPTVYEMADRIAAGGYVVLAPNVFHRAGRAPVLPVDDGFWPAVRPLMNQLTPTVLAQDGAAYLDHLDTAAGPGPVAITGYCMGGRLGWHIAAAHPDRVAALACFHTGRLVTDAAESPHLSAGALKSEVYLAFADEDPSMTADQIATVEQSLRDAGVRHRAEVYAGAHHGYTMADQDAYDMPARERHFRELGTLLERTLG